MAKIDYKTMLKADWQKLAGDYNIEFKTKSTIRYLVEKVAEKIGVDDKIVDDEELKKAVLEKIHSSIEKKNKTKSKTKTKEVEEEPIHIVTDSKLALLRKECDELGVGWSEQHTESDLEQVLNAVKNAGVFNSSVELDISNIDDISDIPQTPEPFNPVVQNAGMQTFNDTQQPIANDPLQVDDSNLDIYRKSFTQSIRGHWRVMALNEITDLFNQANYPFKFEVKRHPQNSNQIEIILTSSGNSKRIPSDNEGDWITING
jgi:hypothetical protein